MRPGRPRPPRPSLSPHALVCTHPRPALTALTLPQFRRAVVQTLARADAERARARRCQGGGRERDVRSSPAPPNSRAPFPQEAGNASFRAGDLDAAWDAYEASLGSAAGALATPALRRRPEFGDLLRCANAALASAHLNLAAVAMKARKGDARGRGRERESGEGTNARGSGWRSRRREKQGLRTKRTPHAARRVRRRRGALRAGGAGRARAGEGALPAGPGARAGAKTK